MIGMLGSGSFWLRMTCAVFLAGTLRAAETNAVPVHVRHLEVARLAVSDGFYELANRALDLYLDATQSQADDPAREREAMFLLGRCLHEQGKHEGLLELIEEDTGRFKRAGQDIAVYWEARSRYELDRIDDALEILGTFGERFPESEHLSKAIRVQAWCYLRLGKEREALETFKNYDTTFRDTSEGANNLLDWGRVLIVAGRLKTAEVVFRDLVKADARVGTVHEGRFWLAEVLREQGRNDEAVKAHLALAQDESVELNLRARSWFSLGDLSPVSTNHPSADGAVMRGMELASDPKLKREGQRRLGVLLVRNGKLDTGIQKLKVYVATDPEDPFSEQMQLFIAHSLLSTGRYDRAVLEYQAYLETYTNQVGWAESHRGRGRAFVKETRFAEAAAAFEKAHTYFEDEKAKEECLFLAADAYFSNEQFTLADETYARFLEKYPDSSLAADAAFQLGESSARRNEFDAAEQLFLEIGSKYPRHARAEEALLQVARLRANTDRLVAAAESYSRVMDLYSNGVFCAEALLGRGLAHYGLFRFKEAREDFAGVVEHHEHGPLVEEAQYWSTLCRYWLGEESEAVSEGEAFLEAHEDSPFAARMLYWLAKYAYNDGDFAGAETRFLQFAREHSTDAKAAFALLWAARAAARQDEYLRSIECIASLLKSYPNSTEIDQARYEQGNTLCELGRFPEAILAFQEIINKFEDSDLRARAWLRTGDCQFMLGIEDVSRYDAAIAAYKAAVDMAGEDEELILQAEYKLGRCLEKKGLANEAVEHYYGKVMIRFLDARAAGREHEQAAKMWFWRASRDAAALLEDQKEWRKVLNILERAKSVGLPTNDLIEERIRKIKEEQWFLFY